MATLTITDIPEATVADLRASAAKNGRSLNDEVLLRLAAEQADEEAKPDTIDAMLDVLSERYRQRADSQLAVSLIRQARDTRG
jgi:plasmid stability protein